MPLVHATTGLTMSERSDMEDVKVDNGDVEVEEQTTNPDDNGNHKDLNFWERRSVGMANRPWMYCGTSMILSLLLGIGGLILGEFSVSVVESRGTDGFARVKWGWLPSHLTRDV